MKRWLPRLPLLLASIAQVGALMPLALVAAHLMPKDGPAGPTWHLPVPGGALSPLLLLVIWLAGWAISDRARRRQAVLIPVLLAGGLLIAWLIQPQASRSQSIAFPLVVLPVLVGAWWGGGQLGMTGLYWHTAFEGLKRSIWICLAGLFFLWVGAPPAAGAFTGPLLFFGAGLTVLFLLRLEGGAIPRRTAAVALAPLLLVALVALLVNPAWIGPTFGLVGRVLSPIVEVIAIPFGYLAWLVMQLIRSLRREGAGAEPLPPPMDEEIVQALPPVEVSHATVQFTAGFLLVLGLILLVLLVRRLMAKHRLQEESSDLDEVRTGPGVLKGLIGDLKALLGARHGASVGNDPLPPGHPRRLLRRLQAWGASQGRERRTGETPVQYAKALVKALPAGTGSTGLDSLAAAYSEARYGSGEPNPRQVEAAERLLTELERPQK